MNVGLPQGFVKFGSVGHKILVFIFEHADARQVDLVEENIASEASIGVALTRLRRSGMVICLGRASAYDTGDRTQAVYALPGTPRRPRLESTQNAPNKARTKKYRENRRKRVSSIFQFRGEIHVAPI
jgi:hypothetical protein